MDRITGYLMDGVEPRRNGSGRDGMAPYENFPTSDGYLFIAAGTDRLWKLLCQNLGAVALIDDGRFASLDMRVRNRADLKAALAEFTQRYASGELLALLAAAGVPASPVRKVSEFIADPQVDAMKLVEQVESDLGELRLVQAPLRINGARARLGLPPLLAPRESSGHQPAQTRSDS
jgi:crotonobetainyl-CoA:carnitine CoA-transferase CaiB-like acyl-CoA transferase